MAGFSCYEYDPTSSWLGFDTEAIDGAVNAALDGLAQDETYGWMQEFLPTVCNEHFHPERVIAKRYQIPLGEVTEAFDLFITTSDELEEVIAELDSIASERPVTMTDVMNVR